MKKILLALIIMMGLGFASCSKDPEPMTKEQMKQKADSVTMIRMRESDDMATPTCAPD